MHPMHSSVWGSFFSVLMNRIFIFLLAVLSLAEVHAASSYRTRPYTEKIRTLQLYLNDNQMDQPVLRMNSQDYVTVAFDWMSHDYPHLAYKLLYCNADWTPTQLSEMDYLEGINEVVMEEPLLSTNTTFDYAHFSFQLPNEDMKMTRSGNYLVKIYDTESPEKILATGCFYIDDNKVSMKTFDITGKSVYGVNNEYQHLTFQLAFQENFQAMPDELTVVVRQNGRHDTEVYGLHPTYVKPEELIYEDERKLSFEGGREFNVIDFSHRFRYSGKIERIAFHHPYYHVEVMPGKHEVGKEYAYDKDVNGHYKVHGQDIWSEAEIDYSIVHFVYPLEEPWLDGSVYVVGGFNDNWLDETNKMVYNFERQQYELALLMKNGGYNFQYLFLPSNWDAANITRTEGSHWETDNEYEVFVYYRQMGVTYEGDQLVGYSLLKK